MCNSFSEVQDVISGAFSAVGDVVNNLQEQTTWIIGEASQGIQSCFETGGHIFASTIMPFVQPLVDKVQSIDFSAILEAGKAFAMSDLGISSIVMTVSLACLVAAREVKNHLAAVALIIAGIGTTVFSSVMLFKPELIRGFAEMA
ncbi:MAG: hypothetical protein JSR46_07020 [Verrucomicrobia bacterium]|nr:hypothetical protein [Verrucomicrobiota bacterium]